MIIGFLFKLFFFYLTFIFLRGIYRFYKTLQIMRTSQEQFKDQWRQRTQGTQKTSSQESTKDDVNQHNGNTVEAEYRVINEKDE